MTRSRSRLIALALAALACASCNGNGGGGGAGSGAEAPPPEHLASGEYSVANGYGGLAWGTSREAVQKAYPDAVPGKRDPRILVRETKFADWPATEAYIFAESGLEEVEIRITPKRSPQESAALGIALDKQFGGVHETSLADDHMYQLAWFGQDTDVRLTYDLRESVPFGPVVTYALRREDPLPKPSATPGSTAAPRGATPGARFSNAVREARKAGLSLASASASPGELTLVYSDATRAVAIQLSADPKSGALLGDAQLVKAAGRGQQRSAEAAIDHELKTSDVTALTFGSKPGLKDVVTVHFGKRWVDLDPKAPNILVGGSINQP